MNDDGFRVDMHVKILDDRVVERAKRRGLDALVYAPHFTRLPEIEAAASTHSDEDLLVIPARELFTGSWRERKHVLAVGLSEPVPDFIPLEAALTELERQGAVVLAPHPAFFSVGLSADEIRELRDRIHAIEVYNPKHLPSHNRLASELARETGLPPFASSYAHLRGSIGEVWTSFDRQFTDADAFVEALRDGADRRIFHRDGAGHARRCVAEFSHLAWENSWQKLDRVLLSGMEPTHPRHLAYEGRFDDVACY